MENQLISESIRHQILAAFEQLKDPVRLLFFGSDQECETCAEARQLIEEVVALSDKLSLDVHSIETEPELARQYKIEHTPALVVAARDGQTITDYGIRLLGIPSGHGFSVLIQDLLIVSSRDSGLTQPTREYLQAIQSPLLMQVFTTPT